MDPASSPAPVSPMNDIEFNREFDENPGKSVKISGNIRRILCDNPGPFTFKGTSTFIIGEGEVAVIDPGPDNDAHLQALLDALGDETVSHIFVTHTHADHSPLAAKMKAATGARTYGFGPHGSGRDQTGAQVDAGGDRAFDPDVRLGHGDVVKGAGWTIEAVHTPGHTSNHMAYALKEEKTLFCGDHVMSWATSVIAPPDGHMGQYLASLRLLLDRDDEIYYPAHGPPPRDPKSLVRAYIAHRRMREEAILNRLAEGEQRIAEIVKANYPDLDPRLHGAAGLSTLAHLEWLIEQGRVKSDGEAAIDSAYRLR
jgi:glyoxylase-like metal-dependent hydrolase (beta-lactamase superfamily II)